MEEDLSNFSKYNLISCVVICLIFVSPKYASNPYPSLRMYNLVSDPNLLLFFNNLYAELEKDPLNGIILAEYSFVPFVCLLCAKNTPGDLCN